MSAYSFVNHRMFVAALNNDAATPPPVERRDARPSRAADKENAGSAPRAGAVSSPTAGVLLANALLHGYQPTVS